MRRRAVIILLSVVLLIFTGVLYFTGRGRKEASANPYSAITNNACFIIETIDLVSFLNSLTTDQGLMGELGKVEGLKEFYGKLRYITDNLNKSQLREIVSEHGPATLSFYNLTGGGGLKTLLSLSVPTDIKLKNIRTSLVSAGFKNISEIKSGKNIILQIPYTGGSDTLFFTLKSGLLIACNSGNLLRESILSIDNDEGVNKYSLFSRVLTATGDDADKIFILFDNLPGVLKPMLAGKNELKPVDELASIAGGDIYISNESFLVSGFIETDSSELLHRFRDIKPASFESYRILPASTGLFETARMNEQVNNHTGTSKILTSLAQNLKNNLGDEITRAYIDIKVNKVSENHLLIYELDNPVQAELLVRNAVPDSDVNWYKPDDQLSIPVYDLKSSGLVNELCPGFTGNISDSLVAFYDKYMITGSSFITLSKLLYDNLLNNTLANDLVYRDFEVSLPSRSGYSFYCVPHRLMGCLEAYLSDDLMNHLKANRSSLNKIQAVGYQLASGGNMIYNSLSIRYKDQVREESRPEWETLLDTTAAIKPFFFTNHLTGAREIFIQDLRNNIYLINAAGRVLWKAPLSERIIGFVYMIDFYRNGKYQLLFNGKNNLHLIDRNGNYVERYPVRLRSPAVNSMALFDYDNNRNYRILIAGEDRRIYAYDKSGNVVKGWKPFRTAGTVRTQMSYFRVSGKDYLAASDEKSLYLLDRFGNTRVSFKAPLTRAPGSALRLNSGSEPYLICSSAEGSIQHIYFDGSIRKFDIQQFSADHSMDIFDIDEDGFYEFIYLDQGKLYLYDNNRVEMFSRDLGSSQLIGPMIFSFTAEDKRIGVFDAENNRIYLFDKDGEITDGFPLGGASMFSIGRLSEMNSWNLIVGGSDKFLYNYKLERVDE